MNRAGWIGIAAATAVLVAIVIVAVRLWGAIGASQITLAGWLAMIFGIIVTLGLGIGLMTLVFISNRRGYDDPGRDEC